MMENITAPEQYELLEMSKISGFINRAKGTGRPTKRIAVNWKTSLRLNSWMTLILISTLKNNIQV